MKWKVFYTDGTTHSSEDEAAIPVKGVAVISQEDGRCGRRILKLMDWYRWDEDHGRWFDCEQFDVLHYLSRHGSVTALRGEYMTDARFEKILIAAHDDPFIQATAPREPPHPAWKK